MSYETVQTCPACGTVIPKRECDEYIAECGSCLRLWDVSEL